MWETEIHSSNGWPGPRNSNHDDDLFWVACSCGTAGRGWSSLDQAEAESVRHLLEHSQRYTVTVACDGIQVAWIRAALDKLMKTRRMSGVEIIETHC